MLHGGCTFPVGFRYAIACFDAGPERFVCILQHMIHDRLLFRTEHEGIRPAVPCAGHRVAETCRRMDMEQPCLFHRPDSGRRHMKLLRNQRIRLLRRLHQAAEETKPCYLMLSLKQGQAVPDLLLPCGQNHCLLLQRPGRLHRRKHRAKCQNSGRTIPFLHPKRKVHGVRLFPVPAFLCQHIALPHCAALSERDLHPHARMNYPAQSLRDTIRKGMVHRPVGYVNDHLGIDLCRLFFSH